ncbi:hypothetical protein REC12_23600 [Desulfosporosinus sp. PR]|uniref:hypothetical protein n=1 Tax=Candidatus Desulfosporosinus nitrosoreducens TaxID=3401928 RepID=UPI0027E6C858|nr:hypothetical protein [Desulfosporosinus sp. PR]MDQ7096585.1 hypothetical protein [Desulfosporosinus sp. PR]
MKKNASILIILIGVTFIIYISLLMPISIKSKYVGIAYRLNDSKFNKKVTVELDGQYNRNSKQFDGKLCINNNEYTPCFFSPATMWICYVGDRRYLMGQVYADEDLKQLTFEINNEQIYYDLTKEPYKGENLFITVPANNKEEAEAIYKKLQQYGVIGN